jgi:transcriptional regulator with XRE-family HTH domain
MPVERTRRKKKLGRYMAALRLSVPGDKELQPADVARKLKASPTTITRLERGDSLPDYRAIVALLGIYGATDAQRKEAELLWDFAKQGATTVENAADMPVKYRAFRRDESDADEEFCLDPCAVSGLLQTGRYARELQESGRRHIRGKGWEQSAADERRSRQRLLEGSSPLRLHSIMDEGVIRRVVGGPEVMREQLRHLLDMGKRDNVTIQIVPFAAGAWASMSGPVIKLRFKDPEEPGVAYCEYAGGGETVENEVDGQAFDDTFEDVSRAKALSADESAKLIGAALDALKEK